MPQKIVAGNWKMNLSLSEATSLVDQIINQNIDPNAKVIFIPPFPFLYSVHKVIEQKNSFALGAQNISSFAKGAYTGEVSGSMLKSVGASYVLIGHSERREIFNEDEDILLLKLEKAYEYGLTPIFCCGEPQNQRQDGLHASYVSRQIEKVLFKLTEDQISNLVVAYEPIWAIGTGLTASPEQAQEMHALIRQVLDTKFEKQIVRDLPLLYGGSVNDSNATELFNQPDIDGGLVGGASLKADQFSSIIASIQ